MTNASKSDALTRTHIVGAATAEGVADLRCGGKTEVRQFYVCALRVGEDVVRLQVTVVDPVLVAVLDGVEDLDEDTLEELVVAGVDEALHHGVEEVAARAEVEDDVDEVVALVRPVDGDDVRVVLDDEMSGDFPLLVAPAAGLGIRLLHDFDGELLRCGVSGRWGWVTGFCDCDAVEDDAVRALPEHLCEEETAVVDGLAEKLGNPRSGVVGHSKGVWEGSVVEEGLAERAGRRSKDEVGVC